MAALGLAHVQLGPYSTAWPLVTLSFVLDVPLCALLALKIVAYSISTKWLFSRSAADLGREYEEWYLKSGKAERTYHDEDDCGRPLPFVRPLALGLPTRLPYRIFGYAFKTPSVIALAWVSLIFGTWTPPALSAVVACLLVLLLLFLLAVALLNRLRLGAFDRFNPDLNVGALAKRYMHDGASPLGHYLLVLIAFTVLGFTVVYAQVNHAFGGAFVSNAGADRAVDPIRWLYFTATIASTVGFGDIHAASNVGTIFVLLQIFAGSLLLTWVAAAFFGESLPSRIVAVGEVDARDHTSNRGRPASEGNGLPLCRRRAPHRQADSSGEDKP